MLVGKRKHKNFAECRSVVDQLSAKNQLEVRPQKKRMFEKIENLFWTSCHSFAEEIRRKQTHRLVQRLVEVLDQFLTIRPRTE